MGYIDRIDDWRRKAEEKAKELEEKYKLREKLDDGLKAAESAVRKGAETVSDAAKLGANAVSAGAEAAQAEFNKIDEDHKVKEQFKKATEKAEEAVKSGAQAAGEAFKSGASRAGEAVHNVGEKARDYYERASDAYNFSQAAARAGGSATDAFKSGFEWVKTNPGKAALVALSLAAGTRLGSIFPDLDVVIIGREGHWFFRSALLAYGTRKLSEKYLDYLKRQKELMAKGDMTEAEKSRIEFQLSAAKYVGAPLLGAFNIAAGAAMLSEIFSPKHIVGFPIDIILGGNPLLESVWLFSNGLICIHNGYEFIMMALAEEEEVKRVVRDIKGLLPNAATA